MLNPSIQDARPDGSATSRQGQRSDRAMTVLQYGLAFLAIGVAGLLAMLH